MKVLHKLFTTSAKSIDDDNKSVDFVISTNKVDRYGDVVDQKSWDLKSYQSNPIVLWGHNPEEPENVLGTASNIQTSNDGSQTTATLNFATDVNAKAQMVFDLIKRGVLRTVSVGFRNHSLEYDEDTPILKDNELLEISVVPIPANAGAVALDFKDGSLNRKDAKWMLESMHKEIQLLEKQMADELNDKEKSMTEEQAQKLIDSLTTLTEKVEAQAATIEELKAAATPPEETEEEKKAREEAEAKAAKEAEEAEAARKAEEDAKNDPAKSGDNDQDGAGEDEFDENAEVTPEQQAEIDAALEAVEV